MCQAHQELRLVVQQSRRSSAAMQVLRQTTEYDALQWSAAVKQFYSEARSLIAAAAEHATRASAERAGIGQWLSGLVLREGKVSRL